MKPSTQRRSLLNNLFLIIVFGAFAVFRLLPVISQQHLVSTAAHHETVQAMPYSENYQSIRGSTDSETMVVFQDAQGKTHTAQTRVSADEQAQMRRHIPITREFLITQDHSEILRDKTAETLDITDWLMIALLAVTLVVHMKTRALPAPIAPNDMPPAARYPLQSTANPRRVLRNNIITLLGITLAALTLGSISGFLALTTWQEKQTFQHAPIAYAAPYGSFRQGSLKTYAVDLRFTTQNGKTITIVDYPVSPMERDQFNAGKTIPVQYLPDNPDVFRFFKAGQDNVAWFATAFCITVAAVWLLVLWLFIRHPYRPMQQT
ncbi:DUF3592 domain-containing protein [Kingella oralis]|uniref:DUF3592 domain-containing protein n=1 Tax=Kingella oralis TaxID=505 RepID=UPI002D7FB023|nr:DUF3592 domain-containing protein [Kingella oralis]